MPRVQRHGTGTDSGFHLNTQKSPFAWFPFDSKVNYTHILSNELYNVCLKKKHRNLKTLLIVGQ